MKKALTKTIPLVYGFLFNCFAPFAPKKVAKKAFYVFCTIRKGRVKPEQKDFLDSAKYESLTIANHTIQTYKWPGTRDTVLLVHGWESNTYRWRNLLTKLKEQNYNIIAFDAPGHGYSSGKYLYVPLYSEVLQHIIELYSPKHLIGHSIAGMTLLYNEHKNNNAEVNKMVAIASASEFYEIMQNYQRILKFNNTVLKALDSYIIDRFGFSIKEFSITEYVKTNTKKGLLFHDRLDQITPYHASEKIHANWKDSIFVSTEGLGHSMHQEEVNNTIIEFLNS